MKTVIIGDIHGKDVWKKIINFEDADSVVFLGDYFDSFDISFEKQMQNFADITEYQKSSNKEVVLLVGNHDYHYLEYIRDTSTSGFNPVYKPQISELLKKADLKMACSLQNFLFTHAGVSHIFLSKHYPNYDIEKVASSLNELFHHKPNVFGFNSQGIDPYGDDVFQSPIWIRPSSLMKSNKNTPLKENYIQVFGHTQQSKVDRAGNHTAGKYYCLDTLDSSGEYMILESNFISFRSFKEIK